MSKIKMQERIVLEKIKAFKNRPFGSVRADSQFKGMDYSIILLTAECAKDTRIMELLGRWRKENENWYLSQFEVTTERTTKWFIDKLTNVPDRLLFIIKSGSDYVGHVGLFRFNFNEATCEIDNILRGENKYPGIIGSAIIEMMKWGAANLGLEGYTLKVLSDNPRAIRLYEKIGYVETMRIPLIRIQGKDGLEWTEAPDGYKGPVTREYVTMTLKDKAVLV